MDTPHRSLDRAHRTIHDLLRALELQGSDHPIRLEIRDAEAGAATRDVSANILNYGSAKEGNTSGTIGMEEGAYRPWQSWALPPHVEWLLSQAMPL
jgi:hypothetical protein